MRRQITLKINMDIERYPEGRHLKHNLINSTILFAVLLKNLKIKTWII